GQWVLADDVRRDLRLQDRDGLLEDRPEDPDRPVVGLDLDVGEVDALGPRLWRADPGALRVDVQHLELALLARREVDRARDLETPNGRDLHQDGEHTPRIGRPCQSLSRRRASAPSPSASSDAE